MKLKAKGNMKIIEIIIKTTITTNKQKHIKQALHFMKVKTERNEEDPLLL